MRRWSHFGLVIFAAALGCGGHGNQPSGPDLSGPLSTDMSIPGGPLCSDPRADPYMPGLTKPSVNGDFNVTLVGSVPGPPSIGNDTWTLEIADKSGAAMNGATITVKPWMPDHGHGTSVTASVTPAGNDGTYTVTPLYLFMAGLWQVTFTIKSSTGTSDTVVFSYCLAEATM
ncbi:MAG TPA: FixH family protein [Polyangia bacterium]|nr:FixH family protein [Polyangia bacterium]